MFLNKAFLPLWDLPSPGPPLCSHSSTVHPPATHKVVSLCFLCRPTHSGAGEEFSNLPACKEPAGRAVLQSVEASATSSSRPYDLSPERQAGFSSSAHTTASWHLLTPRPSGFPRSAPAGLSRNPFCGGITSPIPHPPEKDRRWRVGCAEMSPPPSSRCPGKSGSWLEGCVLFTRLSPRGRWALGAGSVPYSPPNPYDDFARRGVS